MSCLAHVKGAYTGAERDREGRFEYANGGTLFLDEVGDMPLLMQAKLLRVLESGEVVRLGSNDTRHVDVRMISATNRTLPEMVEEGDFREDLYYRIKGVELHIPPLRERREDIPMMVRHFVNRFAGEFDRDPPTVAEDTMKALMAFAWPGNVRQLLNVVQNMVVLARRGCGPAPAPARGGAKPRCGRTGRRGGGGAEHRGPVAGPVGKGGDPRRPADPRRKSRGGGRATGDRRAGRFIES